jgi:hypothetical protein
MGEGDDVEAQHLELAFDRGLVEPAEAPEPGVVDEDLDLDLPPLHLSKQGGRGFRVAEIQRDHFRAHSVSFAYLPGELG